MGLDDRRIEFLFQGKEIDFYFLHSVQSVSGDHPASHLMGNVGSFLEIKRLGGDVTTHLQLLPRLKLRGSIPPLLHLHGVLLK
jgi:hypothetical protein